MEQFILFALGTGEGHKLDVRSSGLWIIEIVKPLAKTRVCHIGRSWGFECPYLTLTSIPYGVSLKESSALVAYVNDLNQLNIE